MRALGETRIESIEDHVLKLLSATPAALEDTTQQASKAAIKAYQKRV